jgi:hypothetical protein
MKLKLKDLLATILFAAIAVPYVGYLINGEMPFIKDPPGTAATGLVLASVAFLVMRRDDLFDRIGKTETTRASSPAPATGPGWGTSRHRHVARGMVHIAPRHVRSFGAPPNPAGRDPSGGVPEVVAFPQPPR